jgi:DnaK suppressor protein
LPALTWVNGLRAPAAPRRGLRQINAGPRATVQNAPTDEDCSMTAFDPVRIRQQLARREAELRELLREHTLEAALEGGDERAASDFKELAEVETQAAVDEAQAAQAVAELQQLHAARARLEDGRYGLCIDCGEPIDPRRLAALPATAYCPSCQARRELRGLRTG